MTFDDWFGSGHKHAVVVYAPSGWVILDRLLDDLLSEAEMKKTQRTVSSRHWRYFGEPVRILSDRVELTAHWGATIIIDLKSGSFVVMSDRFPNLVRFLQGDLHSLRRIEYERGTRDHSETCSREKGRTSCERSNVHTRRRHHYQRRASFVAIRERLAPLQQLLGMVESPSYCGGCDDNFALRLFFEQPSGEYSYSFASSKYSQEDSMTRSILEEVMSHLGFGVAD